jgi:hypothetical protein
MPATVISATLHDTLGWPDATIVSGDAVDIVARLKQQSDVPLRSPASLSLNWALMAAGLVDRLQVTIFPSSPDGPGPARSSAARATSTSTCSRADARRPHPGARLPPHPPLTVESYSPPGGP